jgi:superfamily II DNA or RNA helicase
MRHPEKFGFEDNTEPPPPYYLHIDELPMTSEQIGKANEFFLGIEDDSYFDIGAVKKGITTRTKMAQISRGFLYHKDRVERVPSNKPKYVAEKLKEFGSKQWLIWINYDFEEKILMETMESHGIEGFSVISGETKEDDRVSILESFLNNELRILIAKPQMLGFGLNLQNVHMVMYYGISDSYEQFYQSIRRCYRRGQTENVQAFIPVTHLERQIVDNVSLKSDKWEHMIEEQEKFFIIKSNDKK